MSMPMTPGAGLPPPVDLANALLQPGPAQLFTGVNGSLGVLTVRTPTTTLTIQLPKADILAWAGLIRELGDSLGGGGLLIARPGSVMLP